MKKTKTKLRLQTETIRILDNRKLALVAGGTDLYGGRLDLRLQSLGCRITDQVDGATR